LGTSAQPQIIRDGRLFSSMDHLASTTRNGVALFGMVGTCVQIFRWSPGFDASMRDIGCGSSMQLSASTAGLLMMATLPQKQGEKLLWRLNAEAVPEAKFNPAELGERVSAFRRRGHATGPSGFAPDTQVTAKLLPCPPGERPLALGIVYSADLGLESDDLVSLLSRCINEGQASAMDHVIPVTTPSVMMRPLDRPASAARYAP
jgi:DNA-binding IclR family transcriptional regulator